MRSVIEGVFGQVPGEDRPDHVQGAADLQVVLAVDAGGQRAVGGGGGEPSARLRIRTWSSVTVRLVAFGRSRVIVTWVQLF